MAVVVNIATNANQDLKLSKLLTNVNSQRTAQGQAAFADVNAMSTDVLTSQLIVWVKAMQDAEDQQVAVAYDAATPAIKSQVKATLGLP